MNGTTTISSGSLGYVSSDWQILGTGDFNGDGKADILWKNRTTSQVYVWLMNEITIASTGTPGAPTSAWSIAGVGDFNGDGKSESCGATAPPGRSKSGSATRMRVAAQAPPTTPGKSLPDPRQVAGARFFALKLHNSFANSSMQMPSPWVDWLTAALFCRQICSRILAAARR
jgi:hypothetical protein